MTDEQQANVNKFLLTAYSIYKATQGMDQLKIIERLKALDGSGRMKHSFTDEQRDKIRDEFRTFADVLHFGVFGSEMGLFNLLRDLTTNPNNPDLPVMMLAEAFNATMADMDRAAGKVMADEQPDPTAELLAKLDDMLGKDPLPN